MISKMKIYNKTLLAFAMVLAMLASSCSSDNAPGNESPWVTNYSIKQLIDTFATTTGVLPTRTDNLFSVDTIPTNKTVVISGIVISNDNEGNIYKNIVIQDTISKRAIKIAVDAGNLSAIFPTGRTLTLKCNGLAIGKYAQMYQLGLPVYNTESGKVGFEIGRIPYTLFLKRAQISTTPAANMSRVVDTLKISDILKSGPELHSRLVCIKNAYFTGNGADFGKPAAIANNLKIFAPPTNKIGFPQSREIQDGTGSVFVSTSEYSKFANDSLPKPTVVGNITAIVGWYNDKDATLQSGKIYYQLTLRSINDLGKVYESYKALLK